MFPVLMFGGISGAHINPAMTLAQAINGMFPLGRSAPVYHRPAARCACGPADRVRDLLPALSATPRRRTPIFGTFSTTDAYNSKVNYFVNEFFGTLMLVLGALCCLSLPWGAANPAAASIVVASSCGVW